MLKYSKRIWILLLCLLIALSGTNAVFVSETAAAERTIGSLDELVKAYGTESEGVITITIPEEETILLTETLQIDSGKYVLTGGGTLRRSDSFRASFINLAGGELTLKRITMDGSISAGTANGPLIGLRQSTAALTLEDGCLLENNNNASHSRSLQGGAVGIYDSTSSLKIKGGTIRKNTAQRCGGGVCCRGVSTVEMTGGTISDNRVTEKASRTYGGGGICLENSSFHMSGGTINGNSADTGDAILIDANHLNGQYQFDGDARVSGNCYLGGRYGCLTAAADLNADLSLELDAALKNESRVVVRGTDTYDVQNIESRLYFVNVDAAEGEYIRRGRDNTLYFSELAPNQYRGTIRLSGDGEDLTDTVGFQIKDSDGHVLSPLSSSPSSFAFQPGETYTCTTENTIGYIPTTTQFTVNGDDETYTISLNPSSKALIASAAQLINEYGSEDASNKTITITVPEGKTLLLTNCLEFTRSGYRYILTGGGVLKRSTSYRKALMRIGSNVELDFNDVTLDGNCRQCHASEYMIGVESGGRFVMNDGTICNNYCELHGGIYDLYREGTIHLFGSQIRDNGVQFIMNGGTIRNNYAAYGGAVLAVADMNNIDVAINGGTINDNRSSYGGAVYLAGGSTLEDMDNLIYKEHRVNFRMSGGEMRNNHATKDGGAIYTSTFFTMDLQGGLIAGNTADGDGDGIYDTSENDGDIITAASDMAISDTIYFHDLGYRAQVLRLSGPRQTKLFVQSTSASSSMYEGNVAARGANGYTVTQEDAEMVEIVNEGFAVKAAPADNALTLYIREYTIIFQDDTGRQLSKKTYKYREKVTVPDVQKDNTKTTIYVFRAWSDSATNYTEIPRVRRDVTYRAIFDSYTYSEYFLYLQKKIGRIAYTQNVDDKLTAAEKAYDALSQAEQQQDAVKNAYQRLQQQRGAYKAIYRIKLIGEVSKASGQLINMARQQYDSLNAVGKEMVPKKYVQMLTEAEETYHQLMRGQSIHTDFSVYNVTLTSDPFDIGARATGSGTIGLRYISSNTEVATVDANGRVTPQGIGNAKITITAPETSEYDACTGDVMIKVRKGYQTIHTDVSYGKDVFYLNASSTGDGTITYRTLNPGLATVSRSGKVTAVGIGTVTIEIRAAATERYHAADLQIPFDIIAKKGRIYTAESLRYYVTGDNTDGTGTVVVVGASSTLQSASIPAKVKLGNHEYRVTAINDSAFVGCGKLQKVSIATGVKTIGKSAFAGCTSLTTVSGGSSVTKVDNYAFSGCSRLQSVSIFDKASYLGSSAFRSCKKLKSFTVGSSIRQIAPNAFYGCSRLQSLLIRGVHLQKVGSGALKGISRTACIRVPASCLKKYRRLFRKKGQSSKVRFVKY